MPFPPARPSQLEGKTVKELQSIAAAASVGGANPAESRRLSRAARLHLIDQLSRWGGSGLAVIAGAAIFLTMVIARDLPVRGTVFALLIFASLYLCRRYRKEFRRGDRIAARPFRWRSYYSSTLAVVSAAFGAGAFLLLPEGVTAAAAMQTLALMLVAAAAASAFHIAHRPAAAAIAAPALLAISGAAARTLGPSLFTNVVLTASLAVFIFLAFATAEAERRAAARFPRTAFTRHPIGRATQRPAAAKGDLAAAG